jgi:hypothetical protein
MELHILDRNQRKLPYASLCLYTFAISTPDILLCKNRFLHVISSMYTRAYKLMAYVSKKQTEIYIQTNSSHQISRPLFSANSYFFKRKRGKVMSDIGKLILDNKIGKLE